MGEYLSKWKDIPQSELLLRIVLYHKTWPSGHKSFRQKKVSMATVRAVKDKRNQHLFWQPIVVYTFHILYIYCVFTTHLETRSQQEQHSKAAAAVPASCSTVISVTWDPGRCRALTGTQWWLKQRGWWTGRVSEPSKMWMQPELGRKMYHVIIDLLTNLRIQKN